MWNGLLSTPLIHPATFELKDFSNKNHMSKLFILKKMTLFLMTTGYPIAITQVGRFHILNQNIFVTHKIFLLHL